MIVTSAAATFTFTSCSGTSWYGCYPSHSYNNTWPTSSTAVDVDLVEHAAHDDHDTVQHRNIETSTSSISVVLGSHHNIITNTHKSISILTILWVIMILIMIMIMTKNVSLRG